MVSMGRVLHFDLTALAIGKKPKASPFDYLIYTMAQHLQ
jgi:hypothetical protein